MFIKAQEQYNTLENHVPAPYFRKFFSAKQTGSATVRIATGGFYRLWINGQEYTKGLLAPYIANPDDFIYYDEYEVALQAGDNVIGVLLGNGLQNNAGGYIWDFDKAAFRAAPSFALTLCYADGTVESDTSFKTAPSPILFDDYRLGEHYDATKDITGWNTIGFDDSEWCYALEASVPKGELTLSAVPPISRFEERAPVAITAYDGGYLYDFGVIDAGIVRLTIKGRAGQRIVMQHAEFLKDGKLNLQALWCAYDTPSFEDVQHLVHTDVYICKGDETEVYTPSFVYHGFRYVAVFGISEEQATPDLLTQCVYHSTLHSCGGFSCSDETLNTLQTITRRSGLANMWHFPNDCPQREKNGWTADAALASEFMMLNFTPEMCYRQWMHSIIKAQRKDGALPGIVPTGGWGFHWGNGPAWDCVLVYLPYYVYVYRGETAMIEESADAILRYLQYLSSRRDKHGLCEFGLGDWCHVGDIPPKAPLVVTDTIIAKDIADKASFLLKVIGHIGWKTAKTLSRELTTAFRTHLIEGDTVYGRCQTAQAMALYYGMFKEDEKERALQWLITYIRESRNRMDVGVLGGRVLFHLLSENGYADLAYHLIADPAFPSYSYILSQGATALWERFTVEPQDSLNHMFWGDVSAFFIKRIAGLQFNPTGEDITKVTIAPCFVSALDFAEAFYDSPHGRIAVRWEREDDAISLTLTLPKAMTATMSLKENWCLTSGEKTAIITQGTYRLVQEQL
ncbi:MAG: hypothetical protein E7552_00400 [Ruminococcaceae bacterium]|nr:hypothetical protein [Oscillospiraceae bacterium]